MKINFNTKYTTIAVYSFIVICLCSAFYIIASRIDVFARTIDGAMVILQPFIIGFSMAYILNFILKFYEERLFKLNGFENIKKKPRRYLGLLLTYLTAFLLLYLFMHFVLPQLIESVVGLANDIPEYVNRATETLDKYLLRLNIKEEYFNLAVDKWNDFVNYIINTFTQLIPLLGNLLKTIVSSIWNIILGIIVSGYLLTDKEKFFALGRKVTHALFQKEHASKILELSDRSNKTFGKFLGGKILDSLIIGVLTFFVLTLVRMPYTILISVIIAITNIIPFFGPCFGAIPSAIIVLFVSPIKALWLLLIILIIQQIDGNFIGPKILGDSIGISPFWILFSLLVFGKFLGIVGMIIGVPIFAIIYSIIKDIIEYKLEKKGLPTETSEYM
ncbi:AI-2E family transporter [Asaccharospora irregularis]|uniref:Predicted PurR-regulated permease PerM n=1 Tax=Asaccharospora irregularis DSM 2635 TaxID=1121321 RepID=A0A1M5MYV7_9FIRM|nr:AI-2E family transporter [Asaccharospora irregularis]SHG82478.1 Predicted PurR-regulated permease PerM [Asaccharospora irregularis DSM 2635]